MLREQIRSWRFYDHFRTDVDAPARLPQIGTHTPILGNDGSDMAAALQTILEIGDPGALHDAVADAFPGSSISVLNVEGRFEIAMHQHGMLRPLKAAELSDGTLRYLLWIAALLTPRPPGLLVLNEPETSLHPDLLPALGRLIASAAEGRRSLVVTHAPKLIGTLKNWQIATPSASKRNSARQRSSEQTSWICRFGVGPRGELTTVEPGLIPGSRATAQFCKPALLAGPMPDGPNGC